MIVSNSAPPLNPNTSRLWVRITRQLQQQSQSLPLKTTAIFAILATWHILASSRTLSASIKPRKWSLHNPKVLRCWHHSWHWIHLTCFGQIACKTSYGINFRVLYSVAIFSEIIALTIDSMVTSIYSNKCRSDRDQEMAAVNYGHFHGQQQNHHHVVKAESGKTATSPLSCSYHGEVFLILFGWFVRNMV